MKNLFAKIGKEERHETIQVVMEKPVQERAFPSWEMAYKDIDKVDLPWVNKLLALARNQENYLDKFFEMRNQL